MLDDNLLGSDVHDADGRRIGQLVTLWTHETTDEPSLLGIRTGILGRVHLAPAEGVQADERGLRLPYPASLVRAAPTARVEEDLPDDARDVVHEHYASLAADGRAVDGDRVVDEARIPLVEEDVRVGKRKVVTSAVRLRKVTHTERVMVPVDLVREEVVVERVPVDDPAQDLTDVDLLETHEEPVVEKTRRVREEVHAYKSRERETTPIHTDLRREDVEIDGSGVRGEGGDPP